MKFIGKEGEAFEYAKRQVLAFGVEHYIILLNGEWWVSSAPPSGAPETIKMYPDGSTIRLW